jgi:hypothetical protein
MTAADRDGRGLAGDAARLESGAPQTKNARN